MSADDKANLVYFPFPVMDHLVLAVEMSDDHLLSLNHHPNYESMLHALEQSGVRFLCSLRKLPLKDNGISRNMRTLNKYSLKTNHRI